MHLAGFSFFYGNTPPTTILIGLFDITVLSACLSVCVTAAGTCCGDNGMIPSLFLIRELSRKRLLGYQ